MPAEVGAFGEVLAEEPVGRSLSVSRIARQRKPSGRGWFFAGGWAWPTKPGSRRAAGVAGTLTLTLAKVATGCSSEEPAWVIAWASPHSALPELDGRECDARASSLISVLGPGSGDMMGDRVPAAGGRGRSFYGGRPQGVCQTAPCGDRSIGEPAAPHQRSGSAKRAHRRPGQAAVGSSAGTNAWSPSSRRVW